jgi:hypothetical protein
VTIITCRLAHGFRPGLEADAGLAILSEEEQLQALALSGIRHAAMYGLQVALSALAAKAALDAEDVVPERLGIIANGGPWAADPALGFLRSAFTRGVQYVNPLVFPATLVSAGCTSAAAVVGAKAFSISAGYDELAFFDVLRRGRQFLRYGVADHVVAIAASGHSKALVTALQLAGRTKPLLDCSIAVLMSRSDTGRHENTCGFELVDAVADFEGIPWPNIRRRYEAVVNLDGTISYPLDTPCSSALGLSATGAALCQAAIRLESYGNQKPVDFVVACRKGAHTGAAQFRFRE